MKGDGGGGTGGGWEGGLWVGGAEVAGGIREIAKNKGGVMGVMVQARLGR